MSVTRQFRLRRFGLAVFAVALMLGGCRRPSTGDLLCSAASKGDGIEVDRILAETPDAVNDPEPQIGMTALEFAIIGQHPVIVKTLLQHGANATAYDKMRMSPLAHAIRTGNWSMVQLLLDHGAQIKDVRFMKERVTPLMIAAIGGDGSMAENLLAVGADRTARDTDGMTAADHARSNGYKELAVLLE